MQNERGKLLAESPDGQLFKSADENIEKVDIYRVNRDSKQAGEDIVVKELPLTILLNGRELVTLLCSPANLKYLAIGFLLSEGLLHSRNDIKRIIDDGKRGIVRVETVTDLNGEEEQVFKRIITPGCGRGAAFYSAADAVGMNEVKSDLQVNGAEILELMSHFQQRSETYRSTGGVHSAALCDKKNLNVFSEDIGRHNAIDKIFGQCIWEGISTNNQIILTSGRISSEIVIKIARNNVPVLASKSAPTDTAVKLADLLGITLIGFVRGMRMNVYSHHKRIVSDT
jgi:formate dehydrogenase family accessory protein FdhD